MSTVPQNSRTNPRTSKIAQLIPLDFRDPDGSCRARGSGGDIYRVWYLRQPSKELPSCTCPGGRAGLNCYHRDTARARFLPAPSAPAPVLAGFSLGTSAGAPSAEPNAATGKERYSNITIATTCPPILCARCSGAPAPAEPVNPYVCEECHQRCGDSYRTACICCSHNVPVPCKCENCRGHVPPEPPKRRAQVSDLYA